MIALKIDFVPENTLSYCKNKDLTSGKAYYMEDSLGNIVYGGKICAEKYATNDLLIIPDLTKSLVKKNSYTGTGGTTRGGSRGIAIDHDKSNAISYLVLREEKLKNYPLLKKYSSSKITELYNNYILNNDLTDDEVKRVFFYENNSANNFDRRLSFKNLLTCYAYEYIFDRALELLYSKKKLETVGSLKDYMFKNMKLSDSQIKLLDSIKDVLPQLDECELKKFDY